MLNEFLTLGALVISSVLAGTALTVPVVPSVLAGVAIWAALQFARLLKLRRSLSGNEVMMASTGGYGVTSINVSIP